MQLSPVQRADLDLVAGWLADEENHKWFDFGSGEQVLSATRLAMMLQRDFHDLRLFTNDEDDRPIGVVALSFIARAFKTEPMWYLLGDKSYIGKGYTRCAVSEMLSAAFDELGLQSINAWAVAGNTASVRVLEKNGFRQIGRQRKCHCVQGQMCDRLLFDILDKEHIEQCSATTN